MSQIPLPLAYAAADGIADFHVSPANQPAIALLEAWPGWGHACALIVGPAGSGKTHLIRLFQARCQGVQLTHDPAQWPVWPVARALYLLDDADRGLDPEALFHLYNRVAGNRAFLLLSMEREPGAWAGALPDLRSRLSSALLVRIADPDDALLGAVLVKRLRDRGVDVPPEVVDYVLARVERRFAVMAQVADALDAASLAVKRRITVPLARDVVLALSSG